MTDNKLTDNEIIKALECCGRNNIVGWLENCTECPYKDNKKCLAELPYKALDLINRLQAKVIKEQNKNSKLRNERNRLQAENEKLKENLNIELENYATEYDNKIKAEAYKECIEKVKAISPLRFHIEYTEYYDKPSIDKMVLFIDDNDIDNLLKELVGEDK